jgi:hypothetical protein
VSISVRASGQDLAEVSRKLRKAGDKEAARQFRTELRAAAAPLVPAVRASIAAIPVKGTSGSTGLRKSLQKAVTLRVRTSGKNAQVSVLMSTAKMPSGHKALPAMMEGTKRWRHPVFGNEDVWVSQDAHPYFFKVVRAGGPAAKAAVNRAVGNITRKIT